MEKYKLSGNLVDVVNRRIFKAEVWIENGMVSVVNEVSQCEKQFILPGLIDSHVHIESSMLTPQQFAKIAVKHGTVSTVSDPHEIANVCGVEGIRFMIDDARKCNFKFHFGVPSCVPATGFETSGFLLDSVIVDELLKDPELVCLSEMMNFPGVIYHDEEVFKKMASAKKYNKPIDGHAPGLNGEGLGKYANAGITTDHESVSASEAIEKIKLGIKLQIREGSAAKNFESLISVIKSHPESVMLCTDDCHPDDLVEKHILDLIKRGVAQGYDFFDLLRAATLNPKEHYHLDVGILRVGDPADFFIVDNLTDLHVDSTFVNGVCVYHDGKSLLEVSGTKALNNFNCNPLSIDDMKLKASGKAAKVMLAFDGDLYTGIERIIPKEENGYVVSDTTRDVLKIVLLNRYKPGKPVVGLIKNFDLNKGAIAGSVAHDSHNIIAVGVSDEDLVLAINKVVQMKGGIVAVHGSESYSLPLPIAGLMSDEPGEVVAEKYKLLNQKPKEWGSKLKSPFMTLSFMALLVIPELKIGDKGLFDGNEFKITSLFVD